jgi:hypothetical protein
MTVTGRTQKTGLTTLEYVALISVAVAISTCLLSELPTWPSWVRSSHR